MKNREDFLELQRVALNKAVSEVMDKAAVALTQNPRVKKMMKIVETFLKDNKLVCYGGTAINNILPEESRFYDPVHELPDYDFFSPTALDHAKELADIYLKNGFVHVVAKAGVHHGTYKVFVDFIPVADITQIPDELDAALRAEAVKRNGILYAPPHYLQMAMYLELSRPSGDVSRWSKVLDRLILLNDEYPLEKAGCDLDDTLGREYKGDQKDQRKIHRVLRNALIDEEVVFFGAYAASLYDSYLPPSCRSSKTYQPDFDVLTEDIYGVGSKLQSVLADKGYEAELVEHEGFGEIMSDHVEVKVGEDSVAFLYSPLACHNYNTIVVNHRKVRIATIDTMLSLYLAFTFANRPYHDRERIFCMAKYMFEVQLATDLGRKGPFKRFSIDCIGHQERLEDILLLKAAKHEELKEKKGKEYEQWFLRYEPKNSTKK